jgi:hypothetical protein
MSRLMKFNCLCHLWIVKFDGLHTLVVTYAPGMFSNEKLTNKFAICLFFLLFLGQTIDIVTSRFTSFDVVVYLCPVEMHDR